MNYLKYNQYSKGQETEQTDNRLETHHTHFFFVDDGMTGDRETKSEEQFRKSFEHYILEDLKTPIVVVLLQVIYLIR